MLPNSITSDYQKAIIAGHYIFSTNKFKEIKEVAKKELDNKSIDLNKVLIHAIKKSIKRYLYLFRLLK